MAWDYKSRRLFNNLILQEVLKDLESFQFSPSRILDFGCGDGYLLLKLKETFPNATLYCIESNNLKKSEIIYITLDELKEIDFLLDLVFFIDILYLFPLKDIGKIFTCIKNKVSDRSIIYIVLGIFKENQYNIIDEFRQKIKGKVYIHSLNDLVFLFKNLGFKVYLKKLDYSNIFGVKIPDLQHLKVKQYIDYLYNEKLIIKLSLI